MRPEDIRASPTFTEIVCAHLNKKYFNDDGDDRASITRM